MNFLDAQTDSAALPGRLASHGGLVIVCYCAAWCDTCRDYRPGFEALAARVPESLFIWVDIEENEALLDDHEVENFPTLLVQSPTGNLFFGPMLPHTEHLERLLRGLDASQRGEVKGPGLMKDLV